MQFPEFVNNQKFVPVSISYEVIPAAKEIVLAQGKGRNYVKTPKEYAKEMMKEIFGSKGRVHFSFGTPLVGDYESATWVAFDINKQIIGNSMTFGSTDVACHILSEREDFSGMDLSKGAETAMNQILNIKDPEQKRKVVGLYINPLNNKFNDKMFPVFPNGPKGEIKFI